MAAPVTHLEILGPDRDELVRFYGESFGWLFEAHDEMQYTMFRTAPGGIGGGIGASHDGRAAVTLYAEVESLSNVMMKAQELRSREQTGPTDIGGGARIATITDPAGNVFGLYEGPTGPPPEGAGSPIVWFDVFGPDGEVLIGFYEELFGWKVDRDDGYGHVVAEADGIGGGLWKPMPGMPEHGVLAYISSANLEASLRIIERAGGQTVRPREPVGQGIEIAIFRDPAGNLNGLAEWKRDG